MTTTKKRTDTDIEAEISDLKARLMQAEEDRDWARGQLEDWENAAKHVEANHPDEMHCGCVPVLRRRIMELEAALTTHTPADAGKERSEG